jgi:hypothetical protein
VETLFVQVLRCRTTEIKERLVDAMQEDEAFTKQGATLEQFTRRVVLQSLRPE